MHVVNMQYMKYLTTVLLQYQRLYIEKSNHAFSAFSVYIRRLKKEDIDKKYI